MTTAPRTDVASPQTLTPPHCLMPPHSTPAPLPDDSPCLLPPSLHARLAARLGRLTRLRYSNPTAHTTAYQNRGPVRLSTTPNAIGPPRRPTPPCCLTDDGATGLEERTSTMARHASNCVCRASKRWHWTGRDLGVEGVTLGEDGQ